MKKIYIVMAVLTTAALASCQQEKSFNDEKLGENSVVFTISGGATRSTEATPEVRQGVVIPLETEDGSKFFLEETVVNLNEIGPETKGTPAYTENLGTLYANNLSVYGDKGSFTTAATYENMEKTMYARKDEAQGEGWRYQHNYNGDPWPTDGSAVGFYLNMPASPAGITGNIGRANGKFTFTYTSPTTAAEQQDILFAYRSMTKADHHGYLPNGAPVLFNHALTAVKFAIGNDLEKESVSINSVTFVGLKNKGTNIVMAPVGATEDDEAKEYTDNITNYTSAATVDWSSATADPANNKIASGDYKTVTTYDSGAGSFGTDKGNYPESFSAAGNKNNLGGSDGSQIFWLIPQSFTSESTVKLVVNYTYAGVDGTWTIDFGKLLAGVNWQAGELRTYTLRVNDVNVTITDQFTTAEKNNVQIKNTGNTAAFIRAAIIGQWVDDDNQPIFGFTDYVGGIPTPETIPSWHQDFVNGIGYFGSFTNLALPDRNWVKNSADGYYYYTVPVEPDKYTNALFDKYTIVTAHIPKMYVGGIYKNCHLLIEVATQAISAKNPDGSYRMDGDEYDYMGAWNEAKSLASQASYVTTASN